MLYIVIRVVSECVVFGAALFLALALLNSGHLWWSALICVAIGLSMGCDAAAIHNLARERR